MVDVSYKMMAKCPHTIYYILSSLLARSQTAEEEDLSQCVPDHYTGKLVCPLNAVSLTIRDPTQLNTDLTVKATLGRAATIH